jgi:thiol-disulfide isomerase/thioredoxin
MTTDQDPARDSTDDRAAHPVPPPPSGSSTKALIGVLLAGIAGMIIFLFVHVSKDGRIRTGPPSVHAECTRGQPDCLPEVNYVDTTGVAYNRETLTGKVVLVNFWATWCHPCQKEIPDLSKAYDRYKARGVVFLGVMTDSPDNQQLLNFQSDYEMSYPVVRANSDLMVSFHYPDALPTTFVYDRTGKQVFSRVGPVREAELDSLLGQLVAQK